MKIDFTGKKAIVCGGSRGIGRAIALAFAQCGGDVSICARDAKALEATRAEIAKHGHKAHARDVARQVEDRAQLDRFSERAERLRPPGFVGLRSDGRRRTGRAHAKYHTMRRVSPH